MHRVIFIKQDDLINSKGGNQRVVVSSLIKGFKMQDGMGSEININAFRAYYR